MAHDVFLSYSGEDKTIADSLVASLEANKVRCWYAPRDIKPGSDWGSEIVKAIGACKIFLLIFSANSNQSVHVLDELNLAMTKEKTILPFRIERLDPSGAMELHLSARHWLDAFSPSWEKHIDILVHTVQSYLGIEPQKKEDKPQPSPSVKPERKTAETTESKPKKAVAITKKEASKSKQMGGQREKKSWGLIAGGIAATLLIVGGVFALTRNKEEPIEPTATNRPTEAVFQPLIIPEEVPEAKRTLADSDSSMRAGEKRVLSGDNFQKNLYERPFTSEEMTYQPYLDINTVDFSYDEDFFYFTINMYALEEDREDLAGLYGIEFDLTSDGRGDLVVFVENPKGGWSYENVKVLADRNEDVGGIKPIESDADFFGDGYETEITFADESVAFVRISPDNPASVEFAVSGALLDFPSEFLWGAVADDGFKDITKFDYNDVMPFEEAGSPFIDNEFYPIQSLYSLDNTCRLPFGFAQESATTIPGICINVAPQAPGKPGEKLVCPPGSYLIDGVCTYIY